MAIIEVSGNILTPPISNQPTVICHQVNCMGVMASGLAKQVKELYPQVFREYRILCDSHSGIKDMLLGQAQFVTIKNNLVVANLFGQLNYGCDKRYTNYMALRKALERLALYYDGYTIRIPYKMGCVLGGGNWSIVTQIIRETLLYNDFDVEIMRMG